MGKLLLFSSLLILSLYCFTVVEGLECYECLHVDGLEDLGVIGDYIEKSCKSGKKPDKELLVDCASGEVCGKMIGDPITGVEVTARGCFPPIKGTDSDECLTKDFKITELLEILPKEYRDLLEGFIEDPNVEVELTACTCDTDKCNSSSMLKTTQSLVVLSLGFLASKFAGII